MKSIYGESIFELKLRYVDMLEEEGCLNEVLFNKAEWDDAPYCFSVEHHGVSRILSLIADSVIIDHYGRNYFDYEGAV